jgi:DNA-directed RNA polymerase subunit RPC12/RpoP
MKTCSKCGRELPKENFNKCATNPDGLQYVCKECGSKANKESRERRRALKALDSVTTHDGMCKVYSHPELSKFTPRELMAELKARGFRWEYMLEPQKKIMYDKI